MKAKSRSRFDAGALQKFAGEKVFARGEAYHRDGQVAILAIERARVLALVTGTEEYRTVVAGGGADIGGECSCPAFDDWGFCKHMVAVALAANDVDEDAPEMGALTLIRDHLRQENKVALVRMILSQAERDIDLFRQLFRAARRSGRRAHAKVGRTLPGRAG